MNPGPNLFNIFIDDLGTRGGSQQMKFEDDTVLRDTINREILD